MTLHTIPTGNSSAFWRVLWDDRSLNLYIVFSGARGAPQYIYPGAGEDLIEDWQEASSMGSYFHSWIKPLASADVRRVRSRPSMRNFFGPALRWYFRWQNR